MKTYLTLTPAERINLSSSPFSPAHMAYKIRSLHLMRGRISSNTRSGMMVITDIDTSPAEGSFKSLAAEIYNECLRRDFEGVILDFNSKPTADTSPFASNLCEKLCDMKLPIYVPYLYSVFCPDAKYIVSSSISGGSLREHLDQLSDIHGSTRLSVECERIAMDFMMPSPSAEGKRLSREELNALMQNTQAQTFYSPELCTNYFTYSDHTGKTHFVIFDNAHSITDKLRLAQNLGFDSAFLLYPEIDDIYKEISTYLS